MYKINIEVKDPEEDNASEEPDEEELTTPTEDNDRFEDEVDSEVEWVVQYDPLLNITDISSGGIITIVSNTTLRVPRDIFSYEDDELKVAFILNSDED